MRLLAVIAVLLAGGAVAFFVARDQHVITVTAVAETDPVPSDGDAADDIAIWLHPTDPAKSAIVGTNKRHDGRGGLYVYGLDGKLISQVVRGAMNNVDGRYGFTLGGKKVDVFAATNRADDTLDFFTFDAEKRELSLVGSVDLADQMKLAGFHIPYGVSFYRDVAKDDFYVFASDYTGRVAQLLLKEQDGKITAEPVRYWSENGIVEGMVADEASGHIFIGQEDGGIYRYNALGEMHAGPQPSAPPADKTVVDTVRGHLTADVEGLAIYDVGGGGGYLLASSQGNNRYVIYDRRSLAYLATFEIGDGAIDGVNDTDGIDVISGNLGPAFPRGFLVAQDGNNQPHKQNFKIVDWRSLIEAAMEKKIRIEGKEKFDPRNAAPREKR